MARPEDVSLVEPYGVVLLLGRGDRGETTKTGTSQAVRADRVGVGERLWRYKLLAESEGRKLLFSVRPPVVYAHWNGACRELGLDPGPLHVLRHVGPSYDMLEQEPDERVSLAAARLPGKGPGRGKRSQVSEVKDRQAYRTLPQIQSRGRWAHEKSVARYSKTSFYIKALAETPAWVWEYGADRRRALGPRPVVARA